MNIKYPYLPEGREFIYVPISDLFMAETRKVTLSLSTDSYQPTGAVIVRDGKVLGIGANQSALKNKTLLKLHKNGLCVRKLLKIPSGQKYWLCPGCASSKLHAEPRAIHDAHKNFGDIAGADLYHYGHWWCCKPCWDAMIVAGIKGVYLLEGSEHLFNPKDPQNILGKRS